MHPRPLQQKPIDLGGATNQRREPELKINRFHHGNQFALRILEGYAIEPDVSPLEGQAFDLDLTQNPRVHLAEYERAQPLAARWGGDIEGASGHNREYESN